MKKLAYIAIAALTLTACREDPDLGDLSADYLVFTNYDKSTDFNSFNTYFTPDSVMVITDKEKPDYWTGEKAQPILDAFAENMAEYGYTPAPDKATASVGLQISYVESVRYFVGYNDPYWWSHYPGYWGPGYWGHWDDWYYPYPVIYSYNTGSLLAEMVDLKEPQGEGKKLPVVWNAYMSGLLSGSAKLDMTLTVRAIDQAFAQSPYLDKSN